MKKEYIKIVGPWDDNEKVKDILGEQIPNIFMFLAIMFLIAYTVKTMTYPLIIIIIILCLLFAFIIRISYRKYQKNENIKS